MEETIKLKKESVLVAYKTAREAGKDGICELLEALFGKDTFKPKDVRERIKTFEDACRELGEEHLFVKAYREWMRIEYASCKDIAAYLKLRIIVAALNEGWKPQFAEYRTIWYPWFYVFTKEELERMSEKRRNCLIYSDNSAYVRDGLICTYADYDTSYMNPIVGLHFACKSKELADYCGKQFIDIWADFIC